MIAVDQLIRHDLNGGSRGDCMRACLASLLEIDSSLMPNFADQHGPMAWWDEMRRWLREDWPTLSFAGPLDLGCVESLDMVTEWPDDRYAYAIATVRSPRGPWEHCVVVDRHGDIAHDPYPDATGKLTGPAQVTDDYWLLTIPYDPWPTLITDSPREENP